MIRIALAGISHETNTYCAQVTRKSDFYTYTGQKLLATAGQQNDVGGAVDACRALDCEAIPILFASSQPSGIIERVAYEDFKAEILQGLATAGALDGCVLLLHGAGVVDGVPDLEADLAAAVRALLGDVPITACFDLHANLTQTMADQLNGVFVCHQYPHIDLHQRAAEAVAAVVEMVARNERAQCHLISVPLLLPTTTTYEGIGAQLLEQLLQHEAQAQCLDISWCHGFPYTDVPHVGATVVASFYPAQKAAAVQQAEAFAELLWQHREAFRPLSLNAAQAIEVAQGYATFPVVIHETSDNCGGGAPGDGTHLLRSMLQARLGSQACFAFLVDPETATQAHKAGVGAEIDVVLGGKTDDLHGESIKARAYVKALHDGRLIMQHMFKGSPLNLGPMTRLVIEDLDVVVASRRSQTFDQEPFLAVGINVKKYKYVALKSSNHFRAGFTPVASGIVTADTPGLTTHAIDQFPRHKTKRRLWPIHDDAQFPSINIQ